MDHCKSCELSGTDLLCTGGCYSPFYRSKDKKSCITDCYNDDT